MIADLLKKEIRKRPKLECFIMSLTAIKRTDLAKKIVGLKRDPYTLIMRSYGDQRPNENVYYIHYDKDYSVNGFCSLFRFVLLHLAFAKDINMKPVINWDKHTLYFDDEIKNCQNVFEYYFLPVSDIDYPSVMECKHVVLSKPLDASAFGTIAGYSVPETELEYLGGILREYLHLKNDVKRIFWSEMCSYIDGNKTIGVHVRATDFNNGYNRHPKVVTPDEYLYLTKQAVDTYGFKKVFLATDDEKVISLFYDAFGEKLCYYKDIYRSKHGEPIHYGNNNVKRKHHKFLLGLEILKDFYTLGHCSGLIAGVSNVSMCARIVKASLGEEYVYKKIVDKGVNHSFNETRSVFKPMIKK